MPKDIKTKSTAGLLIIVIIGILIIINLISLNLFSRTDLTDDKIYSLSESSRMLIGDLKDRLTIKAFITEDLPAPHNGDARYLKDLLDDYKAYSHGYLYYEFIDPAKTDREKEAMGYRIPPLQFNVFRNDKTEFIKAYKGIVLLYGNKQEILPFIENTSNLEYDLSRAIKKLTTTMVPLIGFTTGNGEPTMTSGLQMANQVLQEEYRVQFFNLDNMRNLPDRLDALFVVMPTKKLSDWALYLIDQYIMNGGKVSFLLNKFDINIARSIVTPVSNGLDSMLNSYGINIKDNLVIDLQCNIIPIRRDMGGFQVQSIAQYPYYIKASNFNKNIPIVKTIKSIDLLYASPLDFSIPVRSGTERQVLFTSSEKSGLRSAPLDISPEKKYTETDFDKKHLPLGAVITGSLHSYFTDRELPEYVGTDTVSYTPLPTQVDATDDVRIVVIGNGNFITDDFRRNSAGFVVLLNIADWLTQDKGLISIRSRTATVRTLEVASDNAKKLFKYLNILLMPILVVLVGLIRWQFKRSIRKKEIA